MGKSFDAAAPNVKDVGFLFRRRVVVARSPDGIK